MAVTAGHESRIAAYSVCYKITILLFHLTTFYLQVVLFYADQAPCFTTFSQGMGV